jgi:hypothetical protein
LAVLKRRPSETPSPLTRKVYRLEELPRTDVISLRDILCGCVNHPEIKSLKPDGKKCQVHTPGLLRRMAINGGLHHCIGKEVSRFEEGKNDFIESVDDMCIHYDGGRVAANDNLIAEITKRGLRRTTKPLSVRGSTAIKVSGHLVHVNRDRSVIGFSVEFFEGVFKQLSAGDHAQKETASRSIHCSRTPVSGSLRVPGGGHDQRVSRISTD